ncbi:hypothetical protein PGT21_022137 [Puccinia graminis f. sp. tritici]|uniref:Uncharacterized protein n=1 Tax=Puccinia graminis f. sp. tritici TaxID=56615 RepID=A0A5B0Q6I9_PUCGR|nr:hypothetical protein PGT21_022137 [Puccinia graminis f. sp. tritici]
MRIPEVYSMTKPGHFLVAIWSWKPNDIRETSQLAESIRDGRTGSQSKSWSVVEQYQSHPLMLSASMIRPKAIALRYKTLA